MAVLDLLNAYNSNIYLDTDPGWRQFICDHKTYLRIISPVRTPSNQLMTQVRLDLTWYLQHIGVYQPIAWIVGYINDIDSDAYFDHSMPLSVPTISQLDTLYQSYITTRQIKNA